MQSVPHAASLPTPRPTPERRLLTAMVRRAAWEAAHGRNSVREDAQDWFSERSGKPFGWGFVAETLGLSSRLVERIERHALNEAAPVAKRPGPSFPLAARRGFGPVTDAEWDYLKPIVTVRRSTAGRQAMICRRAMLDALLLKRKLGRGTLLPPGYPNWNVVIQLRLRWQRNGVWARVTAVLPVE